MEEIKLQRSVGLYFFLNTITLGIYGMFFWQRLTRDVNKLLWRKDGQHTPGALPLYLFSFLTLGIYFWPWHHRLYRRNFHILWRKLPFTGTAQLFELVCKEV